MIGIDRLRLRVSGMDRLEARKFGERLAEKLAAVSGDFSPRQLSKLVVNTTARPGEQPAQLAERIVDEILRGIGRSAPDGR